MTTPVAKKLQKEEEISMADRIKNLVETIEQLKAALHRAMGALEFANSLVRVKEGKENDRRYAEEYEKGRENDKG